MKYLFLTSLLIFLGFAANAQKEDYIWLFGYDYNTITSAAEEIKFSFCAARGLPQHLPIYLALPSSWCMTIEVQF
jgi:hypothetical protein